MAGRTKTRAVLDRLTKRGAEEDQTALEYVAHYIAGGGLQLTLCSELEDELKYPVSYGMLQRALRMGFTDAEVVKALNNARKEGAHAKIEEAQELADDVAEDKDAIAKAKLQIEMRTWIAERADREAFGATKAAPVQINIQALHLDSLRRLQAPPTLAINAPNGATTVDAEVLSIDEAESIEALL